MNNVQEVVPGISVSTSRVMLTNSVIVGSQNQALLIDPAWMPDELEAIADHLERQGLTVISGFATHAHHDHLLWHPRFGTVPRWASDRTAELSRINRPLLTRSLGEDFPTPLLDLVGDVQEVRGVLPPDHIPPDVEMELVVHDGHVPGHTALWFPEQRVLVAGDMLSDVELPLPLHPGGLADYLQALDILAPFAGQAKIVIPGHGTIGSNAYERLEADRAYLNDVLCNGDSGDTRVGNPGMAQMHERVQQQAGKAMP